MRNMFSLLAWLILCYAVAAFGTLFPPGDYYLQLNKPDWTPPSWLFGPVWSILYTLMAIAAWMIWKQGGFKANRYAMYAFFTQLILNALWSPLFFGLKNPWLALIEICCLFLAIVWTILTFLPRNRIAATLLLPYLMWVGFASVLNAALWLRNPAIGNQTP